MIKRKAFSSLNSFSLQGVHFYFFKQLVSLMSGDEKYIFIVCNLILKLSVTCTTGY